MKKKILLLTAALAMVFSLAACSSDTTTDDTASDDASAVTEAEETEEEGLGSTAEYDGCTLELTGASIETDDETGADVLKITATFTNDNSDPIYALSAFAVKAFQNDVEITDASDINGDDASLLTEVKEGASVDVSYTFELTDASAAVEFYVCSPTADQIELAELIYEP